MTRFIAQGLDMKTWPSLPAAERLQQLRDLLVRDQGPSLHSMPWGRRSLWVFEAIAQARHKFGGRAIGEYIVSGARGPEDILAVLLLARWADITDKRTGESPLDVAPLLESIDSWSGGDVLVSLHARSLPIAVTRVARQSPNGGDRYSDTNKTRRHRGIALGLAGSAGAVVGRGARDPGLIC